VRFLLNGARLDGAVVAVGGGHPSGAESVSASLPKS
jgi:hypothetical protein